MGPAYRHRRGAVVSSRASGGLPRPRAPPPAAAAAAGIEARLHTLCCRKPPGRIPL